MKITAAQAQRLFDEAEKRARALKRRYHARGLKPATAIDLLTDVCVTHFSVLSPAHLDEDQYLDAAERVRKWNAQQGEFGE